MHGKPPGIYTWVAVWLALMVTGAGCGDDAASDDDICSPGDPVDGANCECTADGWVCPSTGDCDILCVDACDLQCAGSGNCDFDCVDACQVACTGSGNCRSEVGANSTVVCSGSGDCDVACNGNCDVECPGQATCTVACAEGAKCTLERCSGEVLDCGDAVQKCNGSRS